MTDDEYEALPLSVRQVVFALVELSRGIESSKAGDNESARAHYANAQLYAEESILGHEWTQAPMRDSSAIAEREDSAHRPNTHGGGARGEG